MHGNKHSWDWANLSGTSSLNHVYLQRAFILSEINGFKS